MRPVQNSTPTLPNTVAEYIAYQENCGIQVGDYVIITHKALGNEHGWSNAWPGQMDEYIGRVCIVTDICNNGIGVRSTDSYDCYADYHFPYFVLEKVGGYNVHD